MPETPLVLLLHGNDEFAISAHVEKLCAGLGDPATAGMNIARFDGRLSLDFEALNSAVNAAPFLAPRRVTVIAHPGSAFQARSKKESDAIESGNMQPESSSQLPESRKRFLALLENAPPTTIIALVESDELKPDHWLLKWVSKAGGRAGVHVYNLPKRWDMPRWIESEAKKQGGRIDPDAAARLSEMVGEEPRIAAQEITKLLTYVNFERPIRLLDVEKVSIANAQASIFELVDALGQKEGKKAQSIFHRLLEDEEAMALWGMVIRQFRLLLQAREMLDERATIPEIQKALGLHEFVVQKVCNQARHFSMPTLESIYHKLLEIDEGAKTSRVPLDLALDTLIVELSQGR